ncbi:hypothetical protein LSPH24S_01614 [Lysinibacillus sphaericus]
MSDQRTDIISYKDFLQKSTKPTVRPCIWKGTDIKAQLDDSLSSDFMGDGRGAVSLINKDTGDKYGVTPTINAVVKYWRQVNIITHTNTVIWLSLLYLKEKAIVSLMARKLSGKKAMYLYLLLGFHTNIAIRLIMKMLFFILSRMYLLFPVWGHGFWKNLLGQEQNMLLKKISRIRMIFYQKSKITSSCQQ